MLTPKEHISEIIADNSAKLLDKYHKGQAEHGGNLWQKPGMIQMLEQEILDATTYQHTIRYQVQSALEYLLNDDVESCKKILVDLLGEPTDK